MDENSMTYEFLKENIYNKIKHKILIFKIKAEYNIISNFLFDANILSSFFKKNLITTVVKHLLKSKKLLSIIIIMKIVLITLY